MPDKERERTLAQIAKFEDAIKNFDWFTPLVANEKEAVAPIILQADYDGKVSELKRLKASLEPAEQEEG